jgi:hypothetical protein
MSANIPIDRQLIIVLNDGTPLIDWQEGVGIDLLSSEFRKYVPSEYNHAIQDDELEVLKRAGRILSFDQRLVFVSSLPEMPRETSA